MNIKGGLAGLPGNPLDKQDEGVFVSKVHDEGAIWRDGRLQVGHRLVEVNGVTLLGASHQVSSPTPYRHRAAHSAAFWRNYEGF